MKQRTDVFQTACVFVVVTAPKSFSVGSRSDPKCLDECEGGQVGRDDQKRWKIVVRNRAESQQDQNLISRRTKALKGL